jgi:endo-1,4-beta-D-glucanase Y
MVWAVAACQPTAPTVTVTPVVPLSLPAPTPRERVFIPFPVTPTLDGELDDWARLPFHTVNTGVLVPLDTYDHRFFTFSLAADDVFLYVAFTTPDRNIVTTPNLDEVWKRDAFEIYLNFTDDRQSQTYQEGMYQIVVGAENLLTQDGRLRVSGVGDYQNILGYAKRDNDGWRVEMAIPLHGQVVPYNGLEIGLQAYASGTNDGTERDAYLVWGANDPTGSAWENPSLLRRAVFYRIAEAPKLSLAPTPTPRNSLWQTLTRVTWEGFKRYYVNCGAPCGDNLGLPFDPSVGYEAVSEGVGYGLLMAVMMDDQAAFDQMYNAAHRYMLDRKTGLLHWRADANGNIIGFGAATDADQDIALALIFAQARADAGGWQQHSTRPYGTRARQILASLHTFAVDGGYLRPGLAWGDDDNLINLSYFSPAWYRVFDAFEGGVRWQALIEAGYALLESTPGSVRGLAPDWATRDGAEASAVCLAAQREPSACLYDTAFEAMRVAWRVGVDCLWFNEPRACDWSRRTVAFLKSTPPEAFALLYTLEGAPIVDYRNEGMIGMWLTAAIASGDAPMIDRLSLDLYNFGEPTINGHWWTRPDFYYNHSLAWFGAALYANLFNLLVPVEPRGQS